jgi:uncharacterized protein YdeI (YjbR/CyaY-like superfamily)
MDMSVACRFSAHSLGDNTDYAGVQGSDRFARQANAVKTQNNTISDVTPVQLFASRTAWASWLEQYHRKSPGLWLRLAKKGSGLKSVSYPAALEVALCYGCIDSQKQRDTDKTWLQKFVPRSDNSVWSKLNRQKALALIRSGKMKPAGREAIERAQRSGHWAPMIPRVAPWCRPISRRRRQL